MLTEKSRRDFLGSTASGMGALALAWLLERDACAQAPESRARSASGLHFPARAKRLLHIFCAGGVSHIDTFDYKPRLAALNGKALEGKGENKGFFGQPGNIMKSPYEFRQHGESGLWVSSLLPNLARHVDELVVIRSMVTKSNNHTPATFQMNTGFSLNGFPCMGSWVSYGLGTENEDLPAFVVLPDLRGMPAGGSINWTSGFLPATHQGVTFRTGAREAMAHLQTPDGVSPPARAAGASLIDRLNRSHADRHPGDSDLEARIRSYELAARMQLSVPEATDLSRESAVTRRLYGLDNKASESFGKSCLLARRLLERGVRFVQVLNGGSFGSPRINWDAHENLKENHDNQAATMDRPVAGLLEDLKLRGMLEDTLVVWSTEFGRGPATQGIGGRGRDHHPDAFSCFLAGAGLRSGTAHGTTDDVGYFVAEKPVTIHDFHATILHLLGVDHERLTHYHNGSRRRLTDVHGEVVREILSR